MTLEQYDDRDGDIVPATLDESLDRLSRWATSATAAYKVADQLVKTSFVPEGFKNKPYEATAAILAGVEVGLSPMAALRSFDVIQGQAAARAITLRAIVQSHGHRMELLESTGTRCRMRGARRGSNDWTTVTWTIDRARDLGLTGKHNWKAQPQAMLVARATSELARLIAADAILGIGYSAEEVADGAGAGVDVASVTITPEPASGSSEPVSGSKRLSRTRRTEPAPPAELEPPDDGDPDGWRRARGVVTLEEPAETVIRRARGDDPASDGDGDRPSDSQTKKIMATFGDLGLTGDEQRAARLALTSALIGREVTSYNEVTGQEASHLIDRLVRINDGELVATVGDDGVWTIEAVEMESRHDNG